MKNDISVVIINYNGKRFVERLVDSLNSQTERYGEVVVVDNNSKDDSYFHFLKNLRDITLFKLNENKGFGYAVNLGVKQSKFKNILLLNNDTFLDKTFIENCLKNIDTCLKYSFFAPLVLNYDGKFIDSAGDSMGRFIRPYKNLNKKEFNDLKLHTKEVEGFSMSICYFRKNSFFESGMLDERFFMYFEDVDFSLRLKKRKEKVLFTPDTIGYHFISASTKFENSMNEYSSKKIFWEGRNRVFLFVKNYQINSIKDWTSFILGTFISGVFHLLKTKDFLSYLNGLISGVMKLKGIKKYE